MRGYNKWGFRPYIPYDRERDKPYICRLVPGTDYIEGEWICNEEGMSSYVYYKGSSETDYAYSPLDSETFRIINLKPETEYVIYIQNGEKKSNERICKTCFVPGVVVNYLHPSDNQYAFSGSCVCSPSLLILPDGSMLASNDYYKRQRPQNLTSVFRSDDGGKSWYYLTDLFPCFWGKLFYHRGKVYMLSTSTEYGDLLIGCSEDEGRTWSAPTVILRGSCSFDENGLHKCPSNIVSCKGRLWTSVDYGSWPGKSFSSSLFSIDENDDPMIAENWSVTGFLPHDKNWEGAADVNGGIEGNVIIGPDGSLNNMLRYTVNKALLLKADPDRPEEMLSFCKVVDFPMGHTKFEVIKQGDKYYAIGNRLPLRNILSLYVSEDLLSWNFVKDLINYEDMPKNLVGFQYPSVVLNDFLHVLSRTAFDHAVNYHDSNFMTYHRFSI